MSIADQQRELCGRFGAPWIPCDMSLKVGVSSNLRTGLRPIHGMRVSPTEGTSGWYIWAGEYSEDPGFFVPLHGAHLLEWAPLVLPYLGLPPGWRFLLADNYEDVWEDANLSSWSSPAH